MNTAFAGTSYRLCIEGEKKFDLVVRLDGNQRKMMTINNLLISTPSGIEIPLSTVANVELKESINQIQRENAQRRIIVGFQCKKPRYTVYGRRFTTKCRKTIENFLLVIP